MPKKNNKNEDFERTLFKAADKLRKNMDAAEYKHIVLGLIFLKYISDSFEDLRAKFVQGKGEYAGADPEDPDEYMAENVFFVPPTARWSYLHSRAKLPSIGNDVDSAMEAIEKENPTLKGILPKVYARPNLDKASLGGLIDLIGDIALGDLIARSKDILGRVYEYFLGEFASAEGKKGGQFYTPKSIVRLMVEMIEPYKGRVYDPCCGSGGMFITSERFVESHQGKINDISIYGQESNQTTYRLCRMNLAIRRYQNNLLTAAQVIEELIKLAKEMRESDKRGQEFGLSDDELAFYDALANNQSARDVLGDDTLRDLSRVLVTKVKANTSIDWTIKENVRAKLRVIVKRTLRQYGYPPDQQLLATERPLCNSHYKGL